MKWVVYVIRHKDSKVGRDLFVGHSAYINRQLGNILKIVLWTHKQVAEERGRKNVAGFKLHKRMVEIGPENWKIVALEGARSSDEAMELVKATCEFLDADLNEWVRER